MKKRNGFTLIELLAVLVVLSVISTIVFPIVSDVISDSEKGAYEEIENSIIRAAKLWATDNSSKLIRVNASNQLEQKNCHVKLSTLKTDGYFEDKETINPQNDENIDGTIIELEYTNNQYKYTIKTSGSSTYSEC